MQMETSNTNLNTKIVQKNLKIEPQPESSPLVDTSHPPLGFESHKYTKIKEENFKASKKNHKKNNNIPHNDTDNKSCSNPSNEKNRKNKQILNTDDATFKFEIKSLNSTIFLFFF